MTIYVKMSLILRGTQRPICCKMYYYTPVNENKCYYGIFRCFSVLLGKHSLFLFPSKTHKKFPSQLDKIGWFPSQLIKFISQPGIPRAFKSLDPKRPEQKRQNRDKTGFFPQAQSLWPAVVCLWRLSGRGIGFFFFFFFFFFARPRSSEFLKPARVEMLEKDSNSQAKPLSITKFPSQLIETPVFLPASKIPLGNR